MKPECVKPVRRVVIHEPIQICAPAFSDGIATWPPSRIRQFAVEKFFAARHVICELRAEADGVRLGDDAVGAVDLERALLDLRAQW